MGVSDQFGLLLWKNYVLQKRRPVATAFELLLPVLFAVVLVAIRTSITVTHYDNTTTWRCVELCCFYVESFFAVLFSLKLDLQTVVSHRIHAYQCSFQFHNSSPLFAVGNLWVS